MDKKKIKLLLIIGIAGLTILTAVSYGGYQIVWSTIDGGSAQSSGGQYVITGTIGQPDAAHSEGSQYELYGGFWAWGPLCFVEFEDFARFAVYWLQSGTGLAADLFEDSFVNSDDLVEFVNVWLCTCPYNWPLR